MTQRENCEPLIKQWGNWGAKWPDEENRKFCPRWRNGTLIWGPFWWRKGMMKLGFPDSLIEKVGALDHLFFSNGLIRLYCTLSNLREPNFNWEILNVMQAEKIHGALNLHCLSYISKIVWWLPMFDFGIFCHLLRLMRIYRVGPCPGIWKVSFSLFFSSFSFFLFFFFSILHFLFSPPSLGGPWTLSTHATQSLRHC